MISVDWERRQEIGMHLGGAKECLSTAIVAYLDGHEFIVIWVMQSSTA